MSSWKTTQMATTIVEYAVKISVHDRLAGHILRTLGVQNTIDQNTVFLIKIYSCVWTSRTKSVIVIGVVTHGGTDSARTPQSGDNSRDMIVFFRLHVAGTWENRRYVPFCWCSRWCCPFWPRTAGGRQKTSKWTDRKPEADEKRAGKRTRATRRVVHTGERGEGDWCERGRFLTVGGAGGGGFNREL